MDKCKYCKHFHEEFDDGWDYQDKSYCDMHKLNDSKDIPECNDYSKYSLRDTILEILFRCLMMVGIGLLLMFMTVVVCVGVM